MFKSLYAIFPFRARLEESFFIFYFVGAGLVPARILFGQPQGLPLRNAGYGLPLRNADYGLPLRNAGYGLP